MYQDTFVALQICAADYKPKSCLLSHDIDIYSKSYIVCLICIVTTCFGWQIAIFESIPVTLYLKSIKYIEHNSLRYCMVIGWAALIYSRTLERRNWIVMQTGYEFVISYVCKEPSGLNQENTRTWTTLISTLRFLEQSHCLRNTHKAHGVYAL